MSDFTPSPFDDADDDLDNRLAEIANGDSFIDTWQRKQKEKPKLDDLSFVAHALKYWWMYFLLAISATFTGTLGFFMGLAPYKTETGIVFQDDGMHIFLAIGYMLAFIAVTEFAFALGEWLFFTREFKNTTQGIAMIIWMIAAGASILFTGYAGGAVIASFVSFMTAFSDISIVTQEWIVRAIPTLFTFYVILGTFYVLGSRENIAKRMVKGRQSNMDLAHETRLQVTKQYGREQVMKAIIRKYIRLVDEGVISQQEAEYAIDKGLSLRELEEQLRRDLDGDGQVGSAPPPILEPQERTNHRQPEFAKRNFTVRSPSKGKK